MSSSVFFKFKSQKEPSRVAFDGTGISVFELKRQIIQINRLGDGSDFDLAIYNQDTNDEYNDDTTIIPRSTSIIAWRLPPTKPGRGTAQRYVSGKMPTNALANAGRREKNYGTPAQPAKKAETEQNNAQSGAPALTGAESEEDMIAAMFQAQSEQWNKTQEQLANATPVYRGGAASGGQGFKKNAAPAPSHPPPTGYVCYRCGLKGHWIQQCPTNTDPSYDGRPRVKRTTGIPRSFLKTVEKPMPPTGDDPSVNPAQNPTSVMVNADGEYVVALADQASWESYQKKAATTTKPDIPKGNKELQDSGIECSICNKLMRDAVKTPCCKKIYCEECIQNALLESDFVCPSCEAKEILLASLLPDEETRNKITEYQKEKESRGVNGVDKKGVRAGVQDNQKSISPLVAPPPSAPTAPAALRGVAPINKSPSIARSSATTTPIPSTASMVSKKRPADDEIGPEVPRGPAAMRQQQQLPMVQQYPNQNGYGPPVSPTNMYNQQAFQQQYPQHGQQAYSNNAYGNYNGMGMNPSMGMNGMGPMGPSPMNGGFGYNTPHGYGFQGGFQQPGFGGNFNVGFNPNFGPQGNFMGPNSFQQQQKFLPGPNNMAMMNPGGGYNGFPNQQKTVFADPFPSDEDSAYMRKPVNPHRHARPKRIRPSDFKAVSGEMM